MAKWRSIKSAPKDGTKIDVWMDVYASPASMGMSDSFAIEDVWWTEGKWVHQYRGAPAELAREYITKWRPTSERAVGTETHRSS